MTYFKYLILSSSSIFFSLSKYLIHCWWKLASESLSDVACKYYLRYKWIPHYIYSLVTFAETVANILCSNLYLRGFFSFIWPELLLAITSISRQKSWIWTGFTVFSWMGRNCTIFPQIGMNKFGIIFLEYPWSINRNDSFKPLDTVRKSTQNCRSPYPHQGSAWANFLLITVSQTATRTINEGEPKFPHKRSVIR